MECDSSRDPSAHCWLQAHGRRCTTLRACWFLSCRSVQSSYAWTRPLVNLGVLMAIAALLATVAFSNEPYLAST